jgi:hypothetical protein
MLVINIRDKLIEQLLSMGLNVYYNGLSLPYYNLNNILKEELAEGMTEIKKIKYCIFEGFKCNMLIFDKFSIFISIFKNIPIKVKSTLIKELANSDKYAAKCIICDNYILSQKFNEAQYEFLADGFISLLDGFVDYDEEFFLH